MLELEQELKNFEKIYEIVINFFVNYSFQVIGAVIIFIGGLMVSKWVSSLLLAMFKKKEEVSEEGTAEAADQPKAEG